MTKIYEAEFMDEKLLADHAEGCAEMAEQLREFIDLLEQQAANPEKFIVAGFQFSASVSDEGKTFEDMAKVQGFNVRMACSGSAIGNSVKQAVATELMGCAGYLTMPIEESEERYAVPEGPVH